MENLEKRVDNNEKKLMKHDDKIEHLLEENARNVASIKSLWENDKKLDKCIERLNNSIDKQNESNLKLANSIDKLEMRMRNEETETKKRNDFRSGVFTKVVFGIMAVLGAGLCTLTLMGIIEWIRQID